MVENNEKVIIELAKEHLESFVDDRNPNQLLLAFGYALQLIEMAMADREKIKADIEEIKAKL